ncbi:DNA-3-methyladenine glycosylase 2 family protein [Streptomyces sp. DSM 40750]|uniref:DNA-3-methyladenine glycosylase 2 family protein n=1 Tax=Streptomyces sp. DSM 40750 TaxID=2801030 RepID=UPI00214CDD92|nr:Ada metal-binding domain-containing protein [Streptomyces sp. DSM 40750]UUU25750.1 helix-turn-helix domain-containing protein [Streptomyces sp. DSM 40750]
MRENEDTRYEAVRSRDGRFDGEFFFAVETTGIYCRPSCPAVTPKRENVRFYATAAAAQGAGFRACRRCRPDAVPGSAEWNVRADAVGRAMRLIGDGVVDREGVAGLAARLGYSARQVQRQLTAEVGAGPVALARAQRAHTARVLLQTTGLPVTEIAFGAGFASVRQFNDTIRAVYAMTPSGLRAARPRRSVGAPTAGIPLRLAYRGLYRSTALFDILAAEAVTGIEEVTGERGHRTYRRTLRLPYGTGIAEVDERPGGRRGRSGAAAYGQPGGRPGRGTADSGGRPGGRPGHMAAGPDGRVGGRTGGRRTMTTPPNGHHGGWLDARLHLTDPRDLTTAVQRLRRLFDLDADPYAVDERLGEDARLAPLVAARPGLRSPGAADPEEFAVRALVGRGEAERLIRAYGKALDAPHGTLTHLFPEPAALAGADGPLGALATALADGRVRLDVGADRDEAEAALRTLPGLDARTVAAIRTRSLGDPDVAPPGETVPDAWRPWRSYALQHLRTADESEPDTASRVQVQGVQS